jgi:hypothetical protein
MKNRAVRAACVGHVQAQTGLGSLCRLLSNATSFMISSSAGEFKASVPYGWNRWCVMQSQAYE